MKRRGVGTEEFARCYEEELRRSRRLTGPVDPRVTVMRAGNATVEFGHKSTGSRGIGERVRRHRGTIRSVDGLDRPAILRFSFLCAPRPAP